MLGELLIKKFEFSNRNISGSLFFTSCFRHSVSCSSLPDGIYELGDCERNFTVCRNG